MICNIKRKLKKNKHKLYGLIIFKDTKVKESFRIDDGEKTEIKLKPKLHIGNGKIEFFLAPAE